VLSEGSLAWIDPSWAEVDLSFLSFIIFIALIAGIVQLVEMIVEKFAPTLYAQLGFSCHLLPLTAPFWADRCLCKNGVTKQLAKQPYLA
jgi:Na+-transporting NADH:ubiquinone oxidoreductase subunit NqrE